MSTREKQFDELRQSVVKESIEPMFEDFGIDKRSGILGKTPKAGKWRYAGYPYIGEQYLKQDVRVVIVGSDLGSDELRIEELKNKGIKEYECGTYLRFERIKDSPTARRAMGKLAEFNTETDLLPYFCMTNVHKFVTINRVGKAGPQNRKWIDKDCELAFLKAELKALKPTIVVFQEPADGNLSDRQVEDLKQSLLKQSLLKQSHDGCTIIRLQHPATRKKGGYRLKEDIEMKIDKALPKALNG